MSDADFEFHPIAQLAESLIDDELDACDIELGAAGKARLATALEEVPLAELEHALWSLVELSRQWTEDPDPDERAPKLSEELISVAAKASDRLVSGRKGTEISEETLATRLSGARRFSRFTADLAWNSSPLQVPEDAPSARALLSFTFARRV